MRIQDLNCLIINLPYRTDRREHIEKEIQKLPVKSWEIVEAINDGSGMATKSHRKCLEIARERKYEQVLILEDDAVFEPDVVEIGNKFLEELPKDWEMAFFGANLQEPAELVSEHVLRDYASWACHTYIIRECLYDVILDLPITREHDIDIRWMKKDHKSYLCRPMQAYQIPSMSDLINRFADYRAELDWNYQRFAV